MVPRAIQELQRLAPTLDSMLAVLARCADTSPRVLEAELQGHVATRTFFLLLEEVERGRNFDGICRRVSVRLGLSVPIVEDLVRSLAEARGHLQSSETEPKATIESLPYYERVRILSSQRNRCAYCGWSFVSVESPERESVDAQQSLEHRIVYRFGGENTKNLVIACSLCNRLKGSAVHIGERGHLWLDNWVAASSERPLAFWRLMRDARCTVASCSAGPADARLFVHRLDGSFINALDSLRTVCRSHVTLALCLRY